ncbi:glutaredoxin domain-containing protein [Falsiroseomonas sp. E2-1-a20]|uniref:glutaredoxin domain-containing protein n=1 Tax=Falsiroseomonas sp. E2-1-a20 TaxID=3239300 RepID=UPI003F2D9A35
MRNDDNIRVYWMTGCTSCLRTKEFLTRHKVAFLSRNVLEDPEAYAELEEFGLRQVPIVTRGGEWVNGQVLADVARIAGIPWGGSKLLPVAELRRRLETMLSATDRFLAQMPEAQLARNLPNRPRSYADLAYHIYNIADAFLEHEDDIPLTFESYNRVPMQGEGTRQTLIAYGQDVQARLSAWFEGSGRGRDWAARADVYYGEQTLHEFLERTTWHAGQHVRQIMWVLEGLGIAPDGKLGPETFVGLPMPVQIWDDMTAQPA